MHLWTGTFQPGRLRGSMRAELEKGITRPGRPEVYPVLALELPSATRYYASSAVAAGSLLYRPRVVEGGWGSIGVGLDTRSNTLSAVEATVEIEDVDRDFATECQRYAGSLRGSVATIRLLSPNVSDDDSYTAFSGVLRGWTQAAPFRWVLRFGPADDALQNGYLSDVQVTKTLFSSAHKDALGAYLPFFYGTHSSQGTTAEGFVPCYCVDTSTYVYIVGLGTVDVDTVYKDGAVVSSGYSITYPVYAGRLWTAIDFTTSQGDSAITADATGLTDAAEGGGTLITNPADQLKHLLANFVFSRWDGRSAYADPGAYPLDLSSFETTRAFFDAHLGHEKARWIGGSTRVRAIDLVNEWATALECKVWWTELGKLAVSPLDYRPLAAPYSSEQWMRLSEDGDDSFAVTADASQLVSAVGLQYHYGEVPAKYFNEALASDLSAGVDVTESRQDRWSKAGA